MAAKYRHNNNNNNNKNVNNDIWQYMPLLVVRKDISCGKYHKMDL